MAGYAVESAGDLLPTLKRALALDGPALVAVPWDHRMNEYIADATGQVRSPMEM
jgi:thiamine pyrophosphate-dependent acetolactate synthase large subunit-like protein